MGTARDRLTSQFSALLGARRPKTYPAHLGTSAQHYERLGISPQLVVPWEDGMRTDGGRGSYEWWYMDAYLDDGAKLAITFRTKPIVEVGKPLEPWIDFNLERSDGTSIVKHLAFSPAQFSASREQCAVVMGPNTFRGDLDAYTIHVEAEGVVADIQLTRTSPAWRPATGCLFFGEQEEYYFAWLPAVPQGQAVVTLALDGTEPRQYTGIGYHDHNWGNTSMLKLMHDWYWARGTIGPYAVIASYITAEQRYANATFPVFMLAKEGKVLADNGANVQFAASDIVLEPDTNKPVANRVVYEYRDANERYVLTFTRKKDLLHFKFVDELRGVKALLARLIGFSGAYLRFGGNLQLDHFHDEALIETYTDEALWELMYFGKVPTASKRSEP